MRVYLQIVVHVFPDHPALLFLLFHGSCYLTHLIRMEIPTLINWASPFPFKELLGGIFHFIQILIEHSVSKQAGPTFPIFPTFPYIFDLLLLFPTFS